MALSQNPLQALLRPALTEEWGGAVSLTSKEAENHFRSWLHGIVTGLVGLTRSAKGIVYISGFEPGMLMPAAAFPRTDNEDDAASINVNDLNNELAKRLRDIDVKKLFDVRRSEDLIWHDSNNNRLIVWLFGRGEVFGLIALQGRSVGMPDEGLTKLRSIVRDLVERVAEENFAFRTHILSDPFGANLTTAEEIQSFHQRVVDNTCTGFGADGAILRLVDGDQLNVVATSGVLEDWIISSRKIGEGASGKIASGQFGDWSAITVEDPSLDRGNLNIGSEERLSLSRAGVKSLVLSRLGPELTATNSDSVGTLSYYFFRPHLYSRRDIHLFRAFARRVSDMLLLREQIVEIGAKNSLLESQASRMTYVEVANLLAHDLWHKGFSVGYDVKEVQRTLHRELNRDGVRWPDITKRNLVETVEAAAKSAVALESTTQTLRAISTAGLQDEAYEPSTFDPAEVVEHVRRTLVPALERQKIAVRVTAPKMRIHGPRYMFEQVIFNLVINSIDAAKGRSRTRPMEIHVNIHSEQKNMILRYWDDGPGIDFVVFPELQSVFKIGATSKKHGTGTGLPIARQLIGSYFKGQLTIDDRRPARFTISIPLAQDE